MVKETIEENAGMGVKGACRRVGAQLGIPDGTIRNWLRGGGRLDAVAGSRQSAGVDAAARIAGLEKENRELRRANAILKSASAFFVAELNRPSTR